MHTAVQDGKKSPEQMGLVRPPKPKTSAHERFLLKLLRFRVKFVLGLLKLGETLAHTPISASSPHIS